jgi:hypothetical protein
MISRYGNDATILGGRVLKSAAGVMRIRAAIKLSQITLRPTVLKSNQRLDVIAGNFYGDGRLWWIIAAASNIGWGLQVPAGTMLFIPTDLSEIQGII